MEKVIKLIIWAVIEIAMVVVIIRLMLDNATVGFAFILPVIGFCFLPEILKEG